MWYPMAARYPARVLLLALTLALVPALLACASVERTVTQRTMREGTGNPYIAWESDRYPDHEARVRGDECWGAAVVGEPVPEPCLTAEALSGETNPWAQAPWIARLGTAVAVPLLLLFAWRRVGWQPEVTRTEIVPTPPPPFDESGAVVLMRSAGTERELRIEAESRRRDLSHPVLTGIVGTVLALALLALAVGYGRAVGWGLVTGMLLLLGGGVPAVLILLNMLRPPNLDAAIGRIRFLTGVTGTLVFGGFIGSYLRTPLLELNGVAWPF